MNKLTYELKAGFTNNAEEFDALMVRALSHIDAQAEKIKRLRDAVMLAVEYLEERGIRNMGTVGRTKVLPALDKALAATEGVE